MVTTNVVKTNAIFAEDSQKLINAESPSLHPDPTNRITETNSVSSNKNSNYSITSRSSSSTPSLNADSFLSLLWSPKDYWYAIVSAFIGAYIGILWTKKQFAVQKEEEKKNCVKRLELCIKFNLERLAQAKTQLENNTVPNYPLDTFQFNHWLAESRDLIAPELVRDLNWQRFQLDHVSSKFVVVNNGLVTWAGQPTTVLQREHQKAIVDSLHKHVSTILAELPPLLNRLPMFG